MKELKPPFQRMTFEEIFALKGTPLREVKSRLTKKVHVNNINYFIKQHAGTTIREIIKNLFQFKLPIISASNEMKALTLLQKKNLLVPNVLGFGKSGINPLTCKSFIILEAIEPSISLEDFTKNWRIHKPTFKDKKKLIEKVAEITARMHQAGINHRDLYICHFLLKEKSLSENEQLPLYLIDFHRAQIRRFVPMRWRIKDLAGLYFSSKDIGLTKRDLLRFIKHYTGKSLRAILKKDKTLWHKTYLRGEQLYRDHQ